MPAHVAYTYAIDADRTALRFVAPGVMGTSGELSRVTGTITTDEQDSPQALEVTIAARSLHTGLALRDLHLKTASFLDARRFPVISYRSQHIERVAPDRFVIDGLLNLHGREHPVRLVAALVANRGQDDAREARQARVTGAVPYLAFNIPRNPVLRGIVRLLIGDKVSITADVGVIRLWEGETPVAQFEGGER